MIDPDRIIIITLLRRHHIEQAQLAFHLSAVLLGYLIHLGPDSRDHRRPVKPREIKGRRIYDRLDHLLVKAYLRSTSQEVFE